MRHHWLPCGSAGACVAVQWLREARLTQLEKKRITKKVFSQLGRQAADEAAQPQQREKVGRCGQAETGIAPFSSSGGQLQEMWNHSFIMGLAEYLCTNLLANVAGFLLSLLHNRLSHAVGL